MIKRFKTYLLTEGFGAVKRDFLKTGKISEDDFAMINSLLTLDLINKDKQGKLAEWVVRWWLKNKDKMKIKIRSNEVEFLDFVHMRIYNKFCYFIDEYLDLKKSKVIKEMPPIDKSIIDLQKWLNGKSISYYSKKKMNIPKTLKSGTDYDEVYHKGSIQVFKILNFDGMAELGKGTKWCVTDRTTWNSYNYNSNLRFYIIRNNRFNSSDDNYKIATVISKPNKINSLWDARDRKMDERNIEKLEIPKSIFKWFEIENRKMEFTESEMKEFDKRFNRWLEDLKKEHIMYIKRKEQWDAGDKSAAKYHKSYEDGSWEDLYFNGFDGFGFSWDWMYGLHELSDFYTDVMAYGDEGDMAPFINIVYPAAQVVIKRGKTNGAVIERIRPKNIIKEYGG